MVEIFLLKFVSGNMEFVLGVVKEEKNVRDQFYLNFTLDMTIHFHTLFLVQEIMT